MSRTLIFGGAFNPVHVGHLRAAIEAVEALGFGQVDWIPSFAPRHKAEPGLLGFDLRAKLLRAAVCRHASFRVNEIEESLPTPSFTFQTLDAISRNASKYELYFLLGDREFLRLHKWIHGREIVKLVHIAVACRTEFDLDLFAAEVTDAWPGVRRVEPPVGAWAAFELVPERRAVLLRMPRLEVSSSLVRQRWLEGRNLEHLLPTAAIELLESHRTEVVAAWNAGLTRVHDAS